MDSPAPSPTNNTHPASFWTPNYGFWNTFHANSPQSIQQTLLSRRQALDEDHVHDQWTSTERVSITYIVGMAWPSVQGALNHNEQGAKCCLLFCVATGVWENWFFRDCVVPFSFFLFSLYFDVSYIHLVAGRSLSSLRRRRSISVQRTIWLRGPQIGATAYSLLTHSINFFFVVAWFPYLDNIIHGRPSS